MSEDRPEPETPAESARWREGFRRHEAIRGVLERHAGLLRTADVKDVAWDLGVSQAALYRLITAYKALGTVEVLMPRTSGRPAGLRLLDKKVEALIAKCIREIYLTPNRPTLKPSPQSAPLNTSNVAIGGDVSLITRWPTFARRSPPQVADFCTPLHTALLVQAHP